MTIDLPHVPSIQTAPLPVEEPPYFEHLARLERVLDMDTGEKHIEVPVQRDEIGRASCRERV